ncbi:MAG: FtsX-like permease family protein [Ruminococcaceae bacterium]|nr:FtsX-like permease family protein [Oscillospiraceae bacterium]
MLFLENISLAISGLLANKMRALLTMLGIIIGIGSVIGIMTVGNSMTTALTESMQSMGATNITVSITQKSSSDTTEGGMTRMFRPSTPAASDLLTDDMIAEYKAAYGDDIFAIGLVESVGSNTAINGTQSAGVNITGCNLEYNDVANEEIINGRFINEYDIDNSKPVAVVSDVLCDELFGANVDPIGKSFTITYGTKIYTFYVVGVFTYEANGFTLSSTDSVPTTTMYIPLSTAKQIDGASAGYQTFTVVGSADAPTDFLDQTEEFFAYYYTRNSTYTATASSMASLMETMTEMMGTMSLAIAVIAAISLVVGGIGVMNIMLVSITERTREIGTRKALGATNGSIRLQFIVESVIICIIGGIIGILVGLMLGAAGAKLLGYAASPSISVIIIAVLFSMAIGVFFGYYPANKAAKMDPVEALRYE